jgi:hypothetical protein
MISFGVKRMSSDLDKLIKRRFMMGFLFKKKMVSFYNERPTRKSAVVKDVSMVVQNVGFRMALFHSYSTALIFCDVCLIEACILRALTW